MAPTEYTRSGPEGAGAESSCLHCGAASGVAHKGACIVPKMQGASGGPRPPAATLTQWRTACAKAYPGQSHDGFCKPVGKDTRRKS